MYGHGIRSGNLDGPLAEVTIGCDAAGSMGSFVRLSQLLDSPVWAKDTPIALSRLWDCITENRSAPLVLEEDESRRCPLLVDTQRMHGEPHPLASVPVVNFPPWVVRSREGLRSLTEYLAAFPTAQGYDSFVRRGHEPDSQPAFRENFDGWGELQMNWRVAGGRSCDYVEQIMFLNGITLPYDTKWYFFPDPDRTGKSIHPLMAWWAVLHALSMLARYQPTEWAGHIDVDRSRFAVPLENLLTIAMVRIPALISDAIWQVAQ